jgi:hypothetical protein
VDPPIRETWPVPIRFPVSRQAAPGPEFLRPETNPKFRVVSPARDQISKIRRRKGRANAGCSRKVSVIRDSGNCVVAHAVKVEPVSIAQFPANREINRDIRRIRPRETILNRRHASKITDLQQNSLISRTGNYFEETGNFTQRTGNFSRPVTIIGRRRFYRAHGQRSVPSYSSWCRRATR